MMSILDKGIGKVVKSLDKKGILENTIILFMADNGAPTAGQHANYGSNFPLKGVIIQISIKCYKNLNSFYFLSKKGDHSKEPLEDHQ